MVAVVLGIPVSVLIVALGVRILRRAYAARAATDALLGSFFGGIGVGSFPALMGFRSDLFGPSWEAPLVAFGQSVSALGYCALFLFTWRCFGSRSRWRRNLAVAGCAASIGLIGFLGVVEGFDGRAASLRFNVVIRLLALVWIFLESYAFLQVMRVRVELGLSQPLVANRFLLWCGWTGSLIGIVSVVMLVRFLLPGFGAESSLALRIGLSACVSALGACTGVSLWLAFFPPDWYVRRFSARRPSTA